ncbi:MAG: BMP family ABC transporter substrate-binding protein [Thermoflavifilum sp.]|nr:BMP family ABC transporter substrate-binding protein [Thermoflavifilum sp.]MCL6515120.1 BMP family ABC transporter substrate-binding protein [Alicyclobacillus sp.]
MKWREWRNTRWPNRKRRAAALSGTVLALSLLSAGCGGAVNTGSANNTTAIGKPFRVALITDVGGLNDHSFNYLSYAGLQRAEQQLGVKGTVVQSKSQSDYVPNLTRFAQQGYDLVIAVGYLMTDAVEQVSKQYPNTHFLIIDVGVTDRPNVAGAVFKTEQSAFLAGAMTGWLEQAQGIPHMNAQNVAGVVAGMKIPPVEEYLAGYIQGFKYADPKGTLLVKWTNDFADSTLGNQMAQSEIQSGADIVFQLAGGAGTGVIQAAKQAGVYAIGADADQSYLAPGTVLTSTLKKVDVATFDVIQETKEGHFQGGVHTFDLAGGGVGLAPFDPTVPAAIQQKVNQLAQDITQGKIKVSANLPAGY